MLALLLCACSHNVTIEPLGEQSIGGQDVRSEEIRFRSGNFEVVGELRLPVEGERHPAIIVVHGDGPATRNGAVPFTPLIEISVRNGYAVFSWDKPGGDIGCRARIYMVEEDQGGFGVIVLTNMENFLKWDDLWLFSTYLQLETLPMEEAQRLWALEHGD